MSHRTRTTVLAMTAAACLAPAALAAQTLPEKLQVHGYLTQGFVASDSLPILGITNKGSVDYRAAALQLRFAATGNDNLVLQLANRRMGQSALNQMESAVEVQWAYYQRRLPANLSAKVGRAPMPRGIFNEVRKVGTVLPFYRAPYAFYTESYETVDGGLLAHAANLGAWRLETSVYGGSVGFRQANRQTLYAPIMTQTARGPMMTGVRPARDTTTTVDERGRHAVGAQLWLSTPIDGLRVGVGGTRFKLDAYQQFTGTDGASTSSVVQGAVDGDFNRFQLRGEWAQFQAHELMYTAFYVQGGVKLTEKLSLNAQREQANTLAAARPLVIGVPSAMLPRTRVRSRASLDAAIGANYAFLPNVVLKIEGHESRGGFDRSTRPGARGRYLISSLALSF